MKVAGFFFLSSWTEAEFGTYFVKAAESLVIFDLGNRGKKMYKTQNNQIHWSRSKFAGEKKSLRLPCCAQAISNHKLDLE